MKIPYLEKNGSASLKVGALFAFGLAAGMIPIVLFWSKPAPQSTTSVASQPPATARPVSALGRIEPKEKVIRLTAPASVQFPRAEKLLVQEGDQVSAGQLVAVLDSYESRLAALAQAEKSVKVALARLAQVEAGAKTGEIDAQTAELGRIRADATGQVSTQRAVIARLQAEWQNAQLQCTRYQRLYQAGAVALSDRDTECLKESTSGNQVREATATLSRLLSTSTKQVDEAKATLSRIAEVRPVDVLVAQAEVDEAQSAVESAKSQLALSQIRTPFAGNILKIHAQPGELIGESGLADLGQTNQMYVVAEVYETDISRIQVGRKASITSPVIKEKLFGKVEQIGWQLGKRKVLGTDPNLDVDAKVIEVKIRLDPVASQKVVKLSNLEVQALIEPN